MSLLQALAVFLSFTVVFFLAGQLKDYLRRIRDFPQRFRHPLRVNLLVAACAALALAVVCLAVTNA